MGLIKAAVESISGTLHDQWKEAIRCEDMDNDTLMVKKTTPTKVISNGSTIIVGPGQCAIIYDNGRIVDATAEEGFYTFDSSSTPSLFAGQFGGFFKEMWQRFTYDGASAKEQAVFFFNLKEIMGNKFGTQSPIMYKDWGHPIMNARTNSYIGMSVNVRCFGMYTFKISDPFLFMQKLAGTADVYKKQEVEEQMRSEVVGSFANVMNSLGSDKYKIEVLELQNKTDEIKAIMDENVFDQAIRDRGLQLVSFIVESVTLDDDSKAKIDNYEIGGDQYQQQGVLTGAYANAIQDAANNANGAATGMMGIGMMNMSAGNAFGGVVNAAGPQYMQPNAEQAQQAQAGQQVVAPVQPQQPVQPETPVAPVAPVTEAPAQTNGKTCVNCGEPLIGKFCTACGTNNEEAPAPQAETKLFCKNCGKEILPGAKFCVECGTSIN